MKLIKTTETELKELYDNSALTWEGLATTEDSLNALVHWLEAHGCTMKTKAIYVTSGKLMNEYYHLTEDNAYPDDLKIVSIKLDNLINASNIIIARFEVGGRWFDDIVDNNINRERR